MLKSPLSKLLGLLVAASALSCKKNLPIDEAIRSFESARSGKCDLEVSVDGAAPFAAVFAWERGNSVLIKSAKASFTLNPQDGVLAIDHETESYEYSPYDPMFKLGPAREFPVWMNLLMGLATEPLPRQMKSGNWRQIGAKGGLTTYALKSGQTPTESGPTATLDANNRLHSLSFGNGVTFTFKGLIYNASLPLDTFTHQPPEEYEASFAPSDVVNKRQGDRLDFRRLNYRGQPLGGDLRLVAVIDPADPTSAASLPWLQQPMAGIEKATAVLKAPSGFAREYVDEAETTLPFWTQSTPSFFLVNRNGDVLGAWIGFDPAQTAAFEADIIKASQGKDDQ